VLALSNQRFAQNLDRAFQWIQAWYGEQLDEKSFDLEQTVIWRSSLTEAQVVAQYGTGQVAWYAALKEVARASVIKPCSNSVITVDYGDGPIAVEYGKRLYYLIAPTIDAAGGYINTTNLGCSFCLPGMASYSGGGLIGKILEPAAPSYADEWTQAVGAVCHEISHGLGAAVSGSFCPELPHSTPGAGSIMFEWWEFPNVTFLQSEKDAILKSSFIS